VNIFLDFDAKELVLNLAPEIATRLENENDLINFLKSRTKD
jgi:hypothetical protein